MLIFDIASIGYTVCAIAFAFLFVILLANWRGHSQSALLITVCVMTVLWSISITYQASSLVVTTWYVESLELIRNALWLSFLFYLLKLRAPNLTVRKTMALLLSISALVVIGGMFIQLGTLSHVDFALSLVAKPLVMMLLALIALILLEQLFRNTPVDQRWAIKFFCIGVGSLFVYEFYLYSDALLMGAINEGLWAARGYVNAMVVPLIAVSAARNPEWALRIHVSKNFVFHSAAIVGAGLYLIAMGAGGYYIKFYGGSWGSIAQIIFLAGALILLGLLLFSGDLRARAKVFLSKNFFHYKYDYRDEWLRLIHAMAQEQSSHQIRSKAIMVIADIVDSPAGILCLKDKEGIYRNSINWNMNDIDITESLNSSLIQFLLKRQWVINIDEYESVPELYHDLELPRWVGLLPQAWIIIPFSHQADLIGFALLARSRVQIKINWEDRDLLLTAARQISSYLVLLNTNEELMDARQFEAFNRLSAYVVHDLKNLVAQLSLVVSNAAKHKDNPEFMQDAIETVENATAKMRKLLADLRKERLENVPIKRVNLRKLMLEVIEKRKTNFPHPELECAEETLLVRSDFDRLFAVIEHLIENAQQATQSSGWVKVSLHTDDDDDGKIVVKICDNGCGMEKSFVEERLFRPFQTTKGNAGMGIGVYEAREHFLSMGGTMNVFSEIGKGTVFTVCLPGEKASYDAVE